MGGKRVTEKDLNGFIIKLKNGGYVLHTPEKRKTITGLKVLEEIDIEAHNSKYLEEIKKRVEIYIQGSKRQKKLKDQCENYGTSQGSIYVLCFKPLFF